MTKLTQHFVRLTAVLSSFGLMACPAEDDNDTAADSTLSTSVSTSMTTTDPGESSSDPTNASAEETTDPTDPTAETTDPTADTTDPTMPQDTGGDCLPTDECQDDSMCAGGMCIGCICIGGGETGTAECGTNVSTMNAACDECLFASCCDVVQACWGDETVMENTACLELNNCIAMNCNGATTIEELQTCVSGMCADFAGELETWLMLNQCIGTSCMADCAG